MLKKARRPWLALERAELARLESLVRDEYARAHPGDTLDDLKRRARFSKGDAGLFADWLEVAARRADNSDTADQEAGGRTVAA